MASELRACQCTYFGLSFALGIFNTNASLTDPRRLFTFRQNFRVVTSQNKSYLRKNPSDFNKQKSQTMSTCGRKMFAKFHANTTVCFLAIVNIREERGRGVNAAPGQAMAYHS